MSTRIPLLLAASWLVLPSMARAQEGAELTPEKVAQIRHDETQAVAKVNEEFGNRKPSEMSSEERAQAIDKQQSATAAVLEKHGVSAKEYARYEARMRPEDNVRAKAEEKRLEERAQAAAKAPAPAGEKAPEDVPVQLGISDEEPVELEVAEGAEPVVDVGVPGAAAPASEEAEVDAVMQEYNALMGQPKPAKRPTARASSGEGAVKKKRVVKRRRSSGDDS
ncbi:hypothetical protein [Pyxidicoccus fallax]|uniref:hypothetical protein n=1 Tax=Pyxidicoccus fallax TaxID=394095 RepID=UPI001FEAC845|nr:hypothetical protein [Pyxidicoccus fallax]